MKLQINDVVQCKSTNTKWLVVGITPVSDGKDWYHMNIISPMAFQGVYEDDIENFYTKIDYRNKDEEDSK